MASFAGADLGAYCYVQTRANPSGLQVNAYPGVSGLEVLDMGSRGGTTHASGTLAGAGMSALVILEQQFRSLQVAGTIGILIDTAGVAWPGVRLVQYAPVGPIYSFPPGLARDYTMEFLHTS